MEQAREAPPPAPPPDEVVAQIRAEIEGGSLIVGPGQFSPWPDHARVGVLRVGGQSPDCEGEPVLVWDAFHPVEHLPALREALGALATVWPGEFDMMYATPWKHAWTLLPASFRMYERGGLTGVLDDGRLRLSDREVAAADVASVLGWADDDAVARGVDVVLRAGPRVTIAMDYELTAAADPTYDRIDLMFDAAWIPALGRSLAASLGVDYAATDRALH